MSDDDRRIAVVLFNLGGPDSPDAVRPFLFNLFNDPAIIPVPNPGRWALAQLISRRRAPFARQNYAIMGGGSPLLPNTTKQAKALQESLADLGRVECFVAMRYWHPFAAETVADVMAFRPDEVVLLPLYPQFAAATSGSSLKDWKRAAAQAGFNEPTHEICCYPRENGFISTMIDSTAQAWKRAAEAGNPRILFSAHGLPKREISRGDPYQWQIEQTASDIASGVTDELGAMPDWTVSYQSRVGPMEWLRPYTDTEIERAGQEGRPLVVVPVSFVSEHVETLVELDVEYRELAHKHGVPVYERVSTVGDGANFIAGLAAMIRSSISGSGSVACGQGGCICPAEFSRCPCLKEMESGK